MADLFTKTVWADGQTVSAANFANRLENGIDAVDTELDLQTDRIDALYASGGAGGALGQALSGPTSSRPAPSIGLPYFDTTLGYVIWGNGSSWVTSTGSAAPGSGSSAAPQHMTAEVQAGGTIGQIVLTWDAVPSATSYKLYEIQSPDGVSGATNLATTTTTRTPSTPRNYEYWVTATVGGVESATSNHVTAVLPYGGGGGGSSDPSTFLNINGLGNGTGGWWNLGLGYVTGHVDITPTQLQNNFIDAPDYCMNDTATAVQFQIYMSGGTTSTNTKYPRAELREYATGSTSTKASWNGASGHHIMRYKAKVMHLEADKPEVVVGQMHDASDDTLQIEAFGASASGPFTWQARVNGTLSGTLASGVALGQEVAFDIDLNGGTLTIKANGVTQYTGNPGYGSGQYFKLGCYPQQNSTDQSNPAMGYARVEIRDVYVSHT